MNRIPVISSNLQSVGYDEKTKILEIKFKTSGVYQFADVPPDVHQGLMQASSKGKFFISHIKNRYRYQRGF